MATLVSQVLSQMQQMASDQTEFLEQGFKTKKTSPTCMTCCLRGQKSCCQNKKIATPNAVDVEGLFEVTFQWPTQK
jgi:hypothetical protein